MWQKLLQWVHCFAQEIRRAFATPVPKASESAVPAGQPLRYQLLERVVLTDGIARTLFEEFENHVTGNRGEEETGWVLLGLREETQAVVLATLPAGARREASVSHVQFNSWSQAVGSRILRQSDRRLVMLGVVHTHPGTLRHPSDADYRGDRIWIRQLRGQEGIFGIGTVDGDPADGIAIAKQPRPNVQCWGKYRFSWYALANGNRNYRPLEVTFTLGPDLARALHGVWPVVETHAERLDRLCRQLANVSFELNEAKPELGIIVNVPLTEPGDAIRIMVGREGVRYFVLHKEEHLAVDPNEERIDRAVYMLLSELVAQAD